MWFWYQIVCSSFCCKEFSKSMFSHIFHSFSKTCVLHQLEKVFLKIFFSKVCVVHISIWCYAFWLNLITLWTFFKTITWFNAYFKFIMCTTYSVLPWKLDTNFWTLSIFIPWGKNGKSLGRSFNFSRYWRSTMGKYPLSFS